MTQDDSSGYDDLTIPSRSRLKRRAPQPKITSTPTLIDQQPPDFKPIPWLLESYFHAEIDLPKELSNRFPQMPLMSLIYFREAGVKVRSAVATISTQDGAASLIVHLDPLSKAVQFTFILNSMLALRFSLNGVNDRERKHWLQEMRGERGEPAFLWDESRWQRDYLIGVSQKHFTNLFAFSPHHVEAAARLTGDVSRKLLDWLDGYWQVGEEEHSAL